MRSIVGRWIAVSALVAGAVTTISPAATGGGTVEAAPSPAANVALTSLLPQRFADTRSGEETIDGLFEGAGRRAAASTYEVQIAGRGEVPLGASGALLNLAAVNPGGFGFFTIYPCDTQPNASALNYVPGVTIANEVVAALSATGSVCVFTLADSDILIDVVGYTMPTDSITTLSPKRYADSRAGFSTFDGQSQAFGRAAAGSTTKVRVGGRGDVPADAVAAIVNVAVVDPNEPGFLTVHACLPTLPLASSINHIAGVNRANELIAELDANGDICIYTKDDVDMIVDVVGFVEADSDLVSVANARYAETRSGETTFDGILQGGGKLAAGSTTTIPIAGRGDVPGDAVAVVANIAAVDPDALGFFMFYPCDQPRPLASSLNYVPGVTGANEIVARLDASGQLCLYTLASSHFILDVVGYLEPNADLTVTKDDNVTAVIFDDTIEYTIDVDNDGPDTAQNVVVTDTLPARVTFVNTIGCAEDPAGTPTCTLGDIASGASKSFTVVGKIQRTIGTVDNLVEVGSDTGDPDLSNNSALEVTDVDQVAPVITSDGAGSTALKTIPENVAAVTDVQSSDHEGDVEGAGLTYSLTTASGGGADNGLFTINADTGVLAFASAPNFENPLDANTDGVYLVQVTVTDTTSLSDRQNFTVEVTNVNEPPNIFSPTDPVDVVENMTAVTDVQSSDPDLDQEEGDGLAYSKTTVAGGGEDNALFIVNPLTGVVTFAAAPDFEVPGDLDEDNEYLLQVTVTDSGGLTDVIDIVVNVLNGNEPPSIVSEGGTTEAPLEIDEGTTAVVDVDSIDDTDSDGAGLTYALTPTPATFDNEFFTIAADGTLSFTVAPDFETPLDANTNNIYLAQVTVTDSGGLTDVQNIVVKVLDVNDEGPNAVDDGYDALEDTQLVVTAPGVLDNDFDVEGDDLTVVLPSTTTSTEGGTVALAADGSFTYDPPEDFFGTDTFEYQAVDALGSNMPSNVATVTIEVAPVNDAPSFTGGADAVVLEDAGPQTVTTWATDLLAGPGETQALNFVVTNNTNLALFSAGPAVSGSNGSLTFTTAPDANGSATITIELVDDGGTANSGENTSAAYEFDIDVTAVNDEPSFTKGSTVTVGEDSGPYAEPAWATDISVGPADESGQIPTFEVIAGNLGLFSTQPAISADGTLTFIPADNATGTTTVTVALMDDGGDDFGGDDTSLLRSFQINITAVNDVPAALDDVYGVVEGESLTVPNFGLNGVRFNDEDVEDGTPTGDVELITPPSNHIGTFSLNADGSFTYDHDGSESPASDSFSYRVTDSAGAYSNIATATINITATNETPVAVADEYDTPEDTELVVAAPGVLDNDTDAEGDALAVALPWATTSVEGGTVALSADGSFTYDPPDDFFGSDSFTYEAFDPAPGSGNTSNTATVTITVNPVNEAPSFTLVDPADQTTPEDSGVQVVEDLLTGTSTGPLNEAGQALSISVTNDNNALFSSQPSIDLVTGDLTYTPAPDANGAATVTVSVSDDGGTPGVDTSPNQTFTITVTPVNDVPSFVKGGDVVVDEDSGAYGPVPWATSISVGPINEGGQAVTFQVTPDDETLFSDGPSISATGDITFTPAANANGSTTVTVTVTDDATAGGPALTSPSQTFEITVLPLNDAPSVVLVTPLDEYIEDDGVVQIDAGPDSFLVSDVDSEFLTSLRVQITGGVDQPNDVLACPGCAALGIGASYSSVTNLLTLSGTASLADYQTALRSITFENNSDDPGGDARTLTVIANDGELASSPQEMTFSFVVRGTIVILKDTDPNDAQSFDFTGDLGAFTLDDDAGAVGEDGEFSNEASFVDILPGTYAVTETSTPGWDLSALTCDDVSGSGDIPTRTATIDLAEGAVVTCTFTNDTLGSITIVKDAVDDDVQSFGFTTTGDGLADFSLVDDGVDGPNTKLFTGVDPTNSPFTVVETSVPGWVLTEIRCSSTEGSSFDITNALGDDASTGFEVGDDRVVITLAPADDTASCTFENTELGAIVVTKQTLPDGDATSFDFTGEIVASLSDGQSSLPLAVLPGSYDVSETVPADWDLTDITCDDDGSTTPSTSTGTTATFEVEPGETVTCTFTNTKRGTIEIVKETVGADVGSFDFTDTIPDATPSSGFTAEVVAAGTVTTTFNSIVPGTYTVAEEDPTPDWDLTSLSCVGNGTEGAINLATATIDLDPGATVTCTFVNTKRGTIEIVKETVGADVGSFDFTDTIPDATPSSGFTAEVVAAGTVTTTFDSIVPGTYTVAEEDPTPDWDLTGLSCTGNGVDGATVLATATATIDLDPGATVTCTYVNTKRGSIVIVKDTEPNDAQDFAFTTTGAGLADFTLDDDAGELGENTDFSDTVTFDNIVPDVTGTYTVTETSVDGWVTTIDCVDSDVAGTASNGAGGVATINVDPGETVTCTYTNDDVRGSIVIVKDAVDNDAQDFAFTATGDGLSGFTLDDDAGAVGENTEFSETVTFDDIVPDATGTYTVTEAPVDGWVTSIDCVDSDVAGTASTGAGGVATINVDPSETVTCTYTNTDVRGSIVIVKDAVDNDAQDFVFTTTGDGLSGFTLDDDGGTAGENTEFSDTATFDDIVPDVAGTYTVTEAPVDGWVTSIECDDAASDNPSTGTGGVATINVDPGETVTCTYTNTELGSIEIVKNAVPNSDQDFEFEASWFDVPLAPDFVLDDDAGAIGEDTTNARNASFELVPGTYTVTETSALGWTLSNIVCTSSGGSTFNVTNSGATDASADFEPGDDRVEISLAAGDLDVSCTFINTNDLEVTPGTITIVKDAQPDDGQDFTFSHDMPFPSPFVLDDNNSGTTPNQMTFTPLAPGSYSITEEPVLEWEVADIVCSSSGESTYTFTGAPGGTNDFEPGDRTVNVLLAPGDNDVVCTFVNDQLGTITVVEDVVGFDLSPTTDAQDFGFTATGAPTALASPFNLDDDAGAAGQDATNASTSVFEDVAAGTYTVTQTPLPAGWVLADITCTSSGGSTFDITNAGSTDASVGFEAGDDRVVITLVEVDDTATCTFVHQDVRGSIVIVKDAVDNDAQDFAFTTTGSGLADFTLDDDAGAEGQDELFSRTVTFDDIVPDATGTYTVTETAVDGWVATIDCVDSMGGGVNSDGADGVATINVDPGETVTCIFSNTDVRGSIVIVKDTNPNDAQDFAFTATGAGLASFTLDDDAGAEGQNTDNSDTVTFDEIVPDVSGTYTVTETAVEGWRTTIDCVDSVGGGTASTGTDGVATIRLDPGETVTCTYTSVEVDQTGVVFTFTESAGDIIMTSSGTIDTANLVPASATGWGLAGIQSDSTDIMGGTTVGSLDTGFGFNAGTDFSAWQTGNPWSSSFFDFIATEGTKAFATYQFAPGIVPGLQVGSADLVGSLWTPDQTWVASGVTFASLGMTPGTYSVSDAVTGETITYQIG